MKKIPVLLSTSSENLTAALSVSQPVATVEAEYGKHLVKGSTPALTLAHHGDRAWMVVGSEATFASEAEAKQANLGEVLRTPAPCNRTLVAPEDLQLIGVSHLDLDTVGGVLTLLGGKPAAESFWKLAEFVDVHGSHRIDEAGATPEDIARMFAWWAWHEEHRGPRPTKDVTDVYGWVVEAEQALQLILKNESSMLAEGAKFKAEGEARNKRTFVERRDNVLIRIGDCFTNDLYRDPDEVPAEGVASFNTLYGSVTVSIAVPEKYPAASCCSMVQSLWGPQAGGHPGIAGGPRGIRMTLKDLDNAAELLKAFLKN